MNKRRTKIICTMGPAVASEKSINKLIKAGMDTARLNFSHGSHDDHGWFVKTIRKCSGENGKPIAVLQDLQGIKIRVGSVQDGKIVLKNGSHIALKPGPGLTNNDTIYISYPALLTDLMPGQKVRIDDGLLELKVLKKEKNNLIAQVRQGGQLSHKKGVNFPDTKISVSPFTDKDREDIEFGVKVEVDYIALSFVRNADDIWAVKKYMMSLGASIPIIAKIEIPEAIIGINEILEVADGIMVARGDLGVEVSLAKVPLIQKDLIRKANDKGKIVITATQMLESMRFNKFPTRAEAADVANAVMDGTDAVMLSAETSAGKFPVETVKTMRHIIETTESKLLIDGFPSMYPKSLFADEKHSFAVAEAADKIVDIVKAKCIVTFTNSGFTAMLISKCRPSVHVLSFTPVEKVERKMSLYWGVRPYYSEEVKDTEEMIEKVEKVIIENRIAKQDEVIIILLSSPFKRGGKTNMLKIHKLGSNGF